MSDDGSNDASSSRGHFRRGSGSEGAAEGAPGDDGPRTSGSASSRFHLTADELRQRAGPSNLREDLRADRIAASKGKGPPSPAPAESGGSEREAAADNQTPDSPRPSSTKSQDEGADFECNVCFETAADPVVTLCGHLFCWSCLARWLATSVVCPVCKAGVKKENVIPVYARGSKKTDPRTRSEPRPQGRRPEPEPQRMFPFGGGLFPGPFHASAGGNAFAMSAGFGLFPSFFGMEFTIGGPQGFGDRTGQNDLASQQAFLSRLFLMLGILVIVALLLY